MENNGTATIPLSLYKKLMDNSNTMDNLKGLLAEAIIVKEHPRVSFSPDPYTDGFITSVEVSMEGMIKVLKHIYGKEVVVRWEK